MLSDWNKTSLQLSKLFSIKIVPAAGVRSEKVNKIRARSPPQFQVSVILGAKSGKIGSLIDAMRNIKYLTNDKD